MPSPAMMCRFGLLGLALASFGCTLQLHRSALPKLTVTQVSTTIYSAIGATSPPSYANWGHNNNLSFIIGSTGVLVVNGGDNYYLAQSLHEQIKRRTELPVRWVVNENGQGHAFLGNAYWAGTGAQIIAHEDAVHEIEEHGEAVLATMLERNLERGENTRVVVPNRSFKKRLVLDLGNTGVELLWFGSAHSPGDISVWVPDQSVLITGDLAFHERLLGVFPDTKVLAWIESFEAMLQLQPETVVPGHGRPSTVEPIQHYTQGYLKYLVQEVNAILERDGGLADAYKIDQSEYSHLDTFDELSAKNAGRVFQQLELEYF